MTQLQQPHKPVMLQEVLQNLSPKNDEVYLDCTFGAGGYSRAILSSAHCKLYAIDRDKTALATAEKLAEEFSKNFVFISGKFSDSAKLLAEKSVSELDGIVLDIGVSSMQLDDKSRGFSFDSAARLDMRMDQTQSWSAYEVVNEVGEDELNYIIKNFGEEPKARSIAKKIVKTREVAPITTCSELAQIVRSFYRGHFKIDPATKTFQALRIHVNQELEELKQVLNSSVTLLKKGGRLVVVSFHSLEDQIVKNFIKEQSGLSQTISRYAPQVVHDQAKQNQIKNFRPVNKAAISPSEEEVAVNPRARSAKLRAAIKI